jgi:phosphohistidine phosphatase SixA
MSEVYEHDRGFTFVVFARHGEKACAPSSDPSLSQAGRKRANDLANVLRDAMVNTIITTEFRRTYETAIPLTKLFKLEPIVVRAADNPSHASQVVDAIHLNKGNAVVVIGHSNTIPEIISRLGGPNIESIPESAYSNLFILSADSQVRFVRAQYGATDRNSDLDCG